MDGLQTEATYSFSFAQRHRRKVVPTSVDILTMPPLGMSSCQSFRTARRVRQLLGGPNVWIMRRPHRAKAQCLDQVPGLLAQRVAWSGHPGLRASGLQVLTTQQARALGLEDGQGHRA